MGILSAFFLIASLLLSIVAKRLHADARDYKRRAEKAETEIAQRDIAARAAQELQDRADAQIDADIRRAFKALEADLNAALRKKPKAKVLRFPTITSGGRVARFDSPPENGAA